MGNSLLFVGNRKKGGFGQNHVLEHTNLKWKYVRKKIDWMDLSQFCNPFKDLKISVSSPTDHTKAFLNLGHGII